MTAVPAICVYHFPLSGGLPKQIDPEQTWSDVVREDFGNDTWTSDKTMALCPIGGKYVLQYDASHAVLKVPINRSWDKFFHAMQTSPIRLFHGPVVMFHSAEEPINWNAFRDAVALHYQTEADNAKILVVSNKEQDE